MDYNSLIVSPAQSKNVVCLPEPVCLGHWLFWFSKQVSAILGVRRHSFAILDSFLEIALLLWNYEMFS